MSSKHAPPGLIVNNEELRIVMVGKTGAGKSATGNTILRREAFQSKFSPMSLTVKCDRARGEVKGRKVAIVDTPGLFDNRYKRAETVAEFKKCTNFVSPGPHVFLVVIKLGRFTDEEQQAVEMIREAFGEGATGYTMVLFTHGDQLRGQPIEEFVDASPDLQVLLSKCNGRYHVFSNDDKDVSQVAELVKKINEMVEENGGSHYTNEMFQRAERAAEEKRQRIQKEKEEQRRREEEKVKEQIKSEYERVVRESEEKNRREMEELRRRHEEEKREATERRRIWEEREEQRRRDEEKERVRAETKREKEREMKEKETCKKMDDLIGQLKAMNEEKTEAEQTRKNEEETQTKRKQIDNPVKAVGAAAGAVVGGLSGAAKGMCEGVVTGIIGGFEEGIQRGGLPGGFFVGLGGGLLGAVTGPVLGLVKGAAEGAAEGAEVAAKLDDEVKAVENRINN